MSDILPNRAPINSALSPSGNISASALLSEACAAHSANQSLSGGLVSEDTRILEAVPITSAASPPILISQQSVNITIFPDNGSYHFSGETQQNYTDRYDGPVPEYVFAQFNLREGCLSNAKFLLDNFYSGGNRSYPDNVRLDIGSVPARNNAGAIVDLPFGGDLVFYSLTIVLSLDNFSVAASPVSAPVYTRRVLVGQLDISYRFKPISVFWTPMPPSSSMVSRSPFHRASFKPIHAMLISVLLFA